MIMLLVKIAGTEVDLYQKSTPIAKTKKLVFFKNYIDIFLWILFFSLIFIFSYGLKSFYSNSKDKRGLEAITSFGIILFFYISCLCGKILFLQKKIEYTLVNHDINIVKKIQNLDIKIADNNEINLDNFKFLLNNQNVHILLYRYNDYIYEIDLQDLSNVNLSNVDLILEQNNDTFIIGNKIIKFTFKNRKLLSIEILTPEGSSKYIYEKNEN